MKMITRLAVITAVLAISTPGHAQSFTRPQSTWEAQVNESMRSVEELGSKSRDEEARRADELRVALLIAVRQALLTAKHDMVVKFAETGWVMSSPGSFVTGHIYDVRYAKGYGDVKTENATLTKKMDAIQGTYNPRTGDYALAFRVRPTHWKHVSSWSTGERDELQATDEPTDITVIRRGNLTTGAYNDEVKKIDRSSP
jgi:hypothetical protein